VEVPVRYPFEPPRVRFLTPIYHPNIDSDGRICLDVLKPQPQGTWSPCMNINTVLLSVQLLMATPNPTDGLVPEISEEFSRNYKAWFAKASKRASDTMLEEAESVAVGSKTASNAFGSSSSSTSSSNSSSSGGEVATTTNTQVVFPDGCHDRVRLASQIENNSTAVRISDSAVGEGDRSESVAKKNRKSET
jgi:ubiquitin-conjugating enzyme E2 T